MSILESIRHKTEARRQGRLIERELLADPGKYFRSVDLREPTLDETISIAQETRQAISERLVKGLSYPTYLQPLNPDILDKCEGQKNIVIEVGGTKMRAIIWQVKGGCLQIIKSCPGPIYGKILDKKGQEKKRFASPEDFFDHLFQALPALTDIIKNNPDVFLSIIFSFPGQPIETGEGLDYEVGELTKGFDIPGLEHQNFIPFLHQYLKEKYNIKPKKTILFNDTPILLKDNIGLVVATGFNFAIKMLVSQLRGIFGPDFALGWKDDDWMLVNLEAGGMGIAQKYAGGNNPRSIFTRVDARSDKPGNAQDEKLISGMYMREELRLVLEDLNEITGGRAVEGLDQDTPVEAEHITMILNDNWRTKMSVGVARIFAERGYFGDLQPHQFYLPFKVNCQYRPIIRDACKIIRDRSAKIVASMIMGGLDLTGEQIVAADVEGSLFWNMPGYRELVIKYLKQLKGNDYQVMIEDARKAERGIADWGSLYYGGIAGLQYAQDIEERLS